MLSLMPPILVLSEKEGRAKSPIKFAICEDFFGFGMALLFVKRGTRCADGVSNRRVRQIIVWMC